MVIEKWKNIEGYEGLYQVSDMGNIRNVRKNKNKSLKLSKTSKGYLSVSLFKNNKAKKYFVHRIVLEAFSGKCPDGKECDHKDRNKENNYLSNLEWKTPTFNNGNKGSRKGSSSRYKGVYWSKQNKRWAAQIKIHGNQRHLGNYLKEEDAAMVYDKEASILGYTTNRELGLYELDQEKEKS